MLKNLKSMKIISVLLILITMSTCFSFAGVQENNEILDLSAGPIAGNTGETITREDKIYFVFLDDEGEEFYGRPVSQQEAIAGIAEREEISVVEAENMLEGQGGITPFGYTYWEYEFEKNVDGYKVVAGALVKNGVGSGHSTFVSVESTWARPAGSGNHNFFKDYCNAVISNNGSKLEVTAKGYVEVKANRSVSASLALKGWSIGMTIGNDYYMRKNVSMSNTWIKN